MAVNANRENKERRILRLRLVAFLVLHLLILLHLYLWYGLGWRGIGAIDMQELFRNLIEKNVLTVGALFFLAFIALGLVWGRFFCGWLCHIGQAYDLLAAAYRKLRIPIHSFPTRWGPLAASFLLVWFFLREAVSHRLAQPAEPLRLALSETEPWELLPGWLNGTVTLTLVLLVMPVFLGRRVFCRNLCPWGVLLGAVNRFSPWKVRRTGNCTMCGECSKACPMDLDVSAMINTRFHVSAVACTNCFQCVASCPTNALGFSLPKRENRTPQPRSFLPPLTYIPWVAELCFWGMTLIVGFVYAELYGIGIFLAFSLGLCLAWLSLRLFLHTRPRPKARWAALILALGLLWAVVAKDGLAHYHYRAGHAAWDRQDLTATQYHYERSDALFWLSPDLLFFRLYKIYKATGQETKRQAMFDRYEVRRKAREKGPDPGERHDRL